MNCLNNIKKRFLIAAIFILAISSTPILESTYAYDNNYGPNPLGVGGYYNYNPQSYNTQVEVAAQAQQNVHTNIKRQEKYRPSYVWAERPQRNVTIEFDAFTPFKDSIDMYQQYANNNIQSATLDDWVIKGFKASGHDFARMYIEHFPLFSPTSLEEGVIRIINPNTSATEKMAGILQIGKEFIPLATKYGNRKLIQRNLDKYITDSSLRTTNIALTKSLRAMDGINYTATGVNLSKELIHKNQYQSEQFRGHDPALKSFEQPSIDLQSYKSLELSQSHMDNFQSLETKSMMETYKPFSTMQGSMHNISATIQLPSHSSSKAFQIPDLSKYQNMTTQMNTQFNNLPSQSTVYRDHFIHNDVGRSFQQQQIYQPQSSVDVDLGTIRISPPSIQHDYYNRMPRYEPIRMPRYKPIRMPPPMPKYDPPPMTFPHR